MARPKARRRGAIHPCGDGKWVIRFPAPRDSTTGRRGRGQETITGSRRDAETRLTQLLAKQDQGETVSRGRETLGAWLEESLTTWGDGLAPQTKQTARQSFRLYLPAAVKNLRLHQLTPAIFQKLYQDLAAAEKSPVTIAILHRALKARINKAIALGRLARSPFVGVRPPRLVHIERQTLSPEQAKAFLAAIESDHYGAFWALMLLVGLRPEETLALKWEDLDGAALQVRRALVWMPKTRWSFEQTKGKRARRVQLPATAQRFLQRQRVRQAKERLRLGEGYADLGLIFATELGTPLRWPNVSRCFRALRTELKLPPMRPYDLRHSAATLLLAAGEHPKVVQEILGHSSITLTLDTYSHVTETMQDRAAQRMEGLVGNGEPLAVQK